MTQGLQQDIRGWYCCPQKDQVDTVPENMNLKVLHQVLANYDNVVIVEQSTANVEIHSLCGLYRYGGAE